MVPQPPEMPALLTRMSSRPSRSSTSASSAFHDVLGGHVVLHEAAGRRSARWLDIGRDHRGAGLGEQRDRGGADARGAAGDDRHLS